MNTKMKILSLAIVGLVGFAGSAFAVCPAGPTTAEGGAWTSKSELPDHASSPLTIVPTGLDASSCHLTASLANTVAAASFVRYTNAASEPNYRFQFLVDTTSLTTLSASATVALLQTPSSAVANGFNRVLRVTVVPGGAAGTHRIRFIAQKGAAPFFANQSSPTDLTPGVHRVEGKLTIGAGAAGALSYWIDAPTGTVEPAATGTLPSLDNGAWGGVSAVTLGLSAPTTSFVSAHNGEAIGFDTFDSRRQTYIGH
jgi:hypothetical protein